MPINEYKPFATGVGANVVNQAAWETDPDLTKGFASGTAASAKFNKVFRQPSVAAAAIAQFINDNALADMRDDGDIAGYVAKLEAALQAYLVKNLIVRPRLVAAQNVHVALGGSDANDGLTAGTAWATLPRAASYVSTLDTGGFPVAVNVHPGAHGQGFQLANGVIGGGTISLIATDGNPANTTITTTNVPCVEATGAAAVVVNGFTLVAGGATAPLRNGIAATRAGLVNYGNCTFGNCSDAQVFAASGGICSGVGNYSITGSSPAHLFTGSGGTITVDVELGVSVVSIIGTPSFSTAFAYAVSSQLQSLGVTFTGAPTGLRYLSERGAWIFTNGGPNYFPGSVAGVATTGNYS